MRWERREVEINGRKVLVLEFDLEGNISPEQLNDILNTVPLKTEDFQNFDIIAFSGRGPVWLFCALCHLAHPSKAVATFDPRIGLVVVESHTPDIKIGEVIKINGETNENK